MKRIPEDRWNVALGPATGHYSEDRRHQGMAEITIVKDLGEIVK